MKLRTLILASVATAGAASTPAAAAIELNYSFSVSSMGPISSSSGTFTLLHDEATDSYTLSALTYSLGSHAFDTTNAGLTRNAFALFIGGNTSGAGTVTNAPGTPDFLMAFAPEGVGLNYGYRPASGGIFSGTAIVTLESAVPEPATWAMMIAGFGAIGGAMRRNFARAAVTSG